MAPSARSGRPASSARSASPARSASSARSARSARPARSARSSRAGGSGGSWKLPATVGVLVCGVLLYDWLADRPVLSVALAVGVVVCGLGAGALYVRVRLSRRRRERERTRSVAAADALSGAEFEQWVASLMRRTGFLEVCVRGGAGDLGADITAMVPEGRLVVQCKRHRAGRPVGSPDVQRFGGTAQGLHDADVAAIVTTSGFTRPAEDAAARLGIGLVDREVLARWAAEGQPPAQLTRRVSAA